MKHVRSCLAVAALAALGLPSKQAFAQLVISDTLTGGHSSYSWVPLGGACLTAGDGTGTIPACVGNSYYTSRNSTLVGGTSGRLPDAAGFGALRLTNGDTTTGTNGNNESGAVVSNFTFPTNEGIQVTWTSVTYGGNNYNGHGADGISFFLSDGAQAPTVGAIGGSLGYSCSNINSQWDSVNNKTIGYDGVQGAYIGIGIDEFGNFSNSGDNTNTGDTSQTQYPKRISVRGSGTTTFAWLNATYPTYYPLSLSDSSRVTAVHNTCKNAAPYNYSGSTITDANGHSIGNGSKTTEQLSTKNNLNYPWIAHSDLPSSVSLANQEATNMPLRGSAVPITYALKITTDGIMNFSYSVNGGSSQSVISNMSITSSNGPLPSSFRFGFSSGTGGGNNVHEITCFKAAPASQSDTSAGSNVQSGRADSNSQIYLAYYHAQNWWGSLTANSLTFDSSTNTLGVNTVANWDANCVLTGGACQATGATAGTAQSPSSRVILTSSVGTNNASTPSAFEWASITNAQQTALTNGDTTATANRLNFLRGDRTNETSNTNGVYRTRTSVLGDIYDSSPVWVGPPSLPYSNLSVDKLARSTTVAEGTSYAGFITSNQSRTNVVYVGANDGMLHGFRAGTLSSSGTLGGTNDGLELIAYVPAQVAASIHQTLPTLDYSSPSYSHNFYVDGTPGTGDLYYSGGWHTWVVGGLGPGGHPGGPVGDNTSTFGTTANPGPAGTIYAIDATNPANFSESNASSLVMGEWSSSSISCVNATTCGTHLGQVSGIPQIRRLHDGNWAVLFGNGLNSTSGTAGLFIMEVNSTTGAKTFRYIDTGSGSSNGIVNVTPVDLDGDHITDYVYAGDVNGNVWRFDLTSATASSWSVGSTPLFTTPSGQPITTKVVVNSVAAPSATGLPKVLVSFGTGQKQPLTQTSAEAFAASGQRLYGIWDWNMAAWNATTTDTKYDSLTSPQTVNSSVLAAQTVTSTLAGTSTVSGYRVVSTNPVCWKGSTACGASAGSNTQYGWSLALPGTQEQVIYNPTTAYGMFIVNTTIPGGTQALTCSSVPATGYTMAIQLTNGGAATNAPFFQDSSNTFSTANIAGVGVNGTGTPSIVAYPNPTTGIASPYLVTQTSDGTGKATQLNPTGVTGARLNWTKAR